LALSKPLLRRNRKLEHCSLPHFRFHPNAAAETLNDLPAKRKANARTGNFLAMQTLKHAEYVLGIRRIDANTVIA
jgi:hypothetical protein